MHQPADTPSHSHTQTNKVMLILEDIHRTDIGRSMQRNSHTPPAEHHEREQNISLYPQHLRDSVMGML